MFANAIKELGSAFILRDSLAILTTHHQESILNQLLRGWQLEFGPSLMIIYIEGDGDDTTIAGPKHVVDMQFKMVSSLRVYLTIPEEQTRTYIKDHTQIIKNTHMDTSWSRLTQEVPRKAQEHLYLGILSSTQEQNHLVEEERRCNNIALLWPTSRKMKSKTVTKFLQ